MGKLVAIETYARFETLWEASQISDTSLTFILDTGLLYTHGIFINSVSYGIEASGYVPITVAGVTKNISLHGHTHSDYYSNSADIDIGSHKIVSGSSNLLQYSSGDILIGNSSNPTYVYGTLNTNRNNTNYTVLDTGNFSIVLTTTTNLPLSNVATFKYGSNSFQLDYVKRVELISTFDLLSTYTNFGTLSESSKWYGFMTMYTDSNTTNPKYALIRVDITGNKLEFRTSSHTAWTGTLEGGAYSNLSINGSNYSMATKAASLPSIWAPTSLGVDGLVLGTNGTALQWMTVERDPQYTATITGANLTTSWSDIDSLNSRLSAGNGSYMVQITYASCIYTGVFSYVQGGAIDDEIILHCSGTTSSVNGTDRGRLFAKIGTTSSTTYLRLATSLNESNANLSIKYRKLI